MSTYTQLQSRIADDINRTDLTTQIAQCILLAIQHYKSERMWFNETNTTLTATASQAYVTAPTDIVLIDHFYITISGVNIELVPAAIQDIIEYRPSTNGRPLAFSYYQNRFELDRKSDSTYSMPLYYVKELAALSAASDSNGWTTDAEDLVVFHAEKKIYANVIKDQGKAAVAQAQEMAALGALRALRNARTTRGYTKAYYL